MKRSLAVFLIVLAGAAVLAFCVVFVFRHGQRPKTKNPATMDPALLESLLTPTASPEVKGTFDQKTRPSPSPN